MQKVSIANLQPGMITAHNVYNADGTVLIKADVEISIQNSKRLKQFGLGSIYIKNQLFDGIEFPELVTEDTRLRAIQVVQSAFVNFSKTQDVNIEPFKELANSIVDEIILNRDMLVQLVDTRTYDDYLYGHSVNVCILSVLTGLALEYNEGKLRELALGALLHDLGYLLIPTEIADKPGKLTPEEAGIIQQHTTKGFEALRKVYGVSIPAAHIAFQHHENFDGTGYPRRLQGDEIHEYARIAKIADIFDALVADRKYRKAFLPHEAYELLMTLSNKFVDNKILEVFLGNIAIYPVGSVVKLNTGEFGIVTKVSRKMQARPIVRVITDKNGQLLHNAEEVDLTQQLTVFIEKLLKEQDVIELNKQLKGLVP